MQNLNDEKKAGQTLPPLTGHNSKGSLVSSLVHCCSGDDSNLSDSNSQDKTVSGWGDVQENQPDTVSLPGVDRGDDPHMLIGGSLHFPSGEISEILFDSVTIDEKNNKKPDVSCLDLINHSCDWLSVTVPPETSKHLLAESTPLKPGGGSFGFSKTEFRNCIGGSCLRKYESITKDCPLKTLWGSFESWEFGGKNMVSEIYYRTLSTHTCKPTRIDMAFDYKVASDFYPKDFMSLFRSEIDSAGFKPGWYGNETSYTCYLGTRKSGLYLRVYRKDIQDPSWKKYGAVLRVEIELRHDRAVSLWDFYLANGRAASFSFAASYINRMCGFKALPDDLPELPIISNTRDSSVAVKTYHLINQWGSFLAVLLRYGVQLSDLVSLKDGKNSRMSKNNISAIERALCTYDDPADFVREVSYLFDAGCC